MTLSVRFHDNNSSLSFLITLIFLQEGTNQTNNIIKIIIIILGRNLFTSEGNLRGGLGSGPFMITPTRLCANRCPHPGLTNLELGRVYLYFR